MSLLNVNSDSRSVLLVLSTMTRQARLASGRAVHCGFADVRYARDARWLIAQSLGTAIARVA